MDKFIIEIKTGATESDIYIKIQQCKDEQSYSKVIVTESFKDLSVFLISFQQQHIKAYHKNPGQIITQMQLWYETKRIKKKDRYYEYQRQYLFNSFIADKHQQTGYGQNPEQGYQKKHMYNYIS